MGFIVHPSNWEASHARAIFDGQAYQASHDGRLPETAMWKMLEFRHELNPARFARWHPNIALILEDRDPTSFRLSSFHGPRGRHRQLRIRDLRGDDDAVDAPPITEAIAPPPSSGVTTTSTEPPRTFDVPTVAEPATALQGMTAVMLAAAYFARRRKRNQSKD